MNSNYKPYRLINTQELLELQLAFEKKLQPWNEQYALFPLSCELTRNPTTPAIQNNAIMFYDNAQPIALLPLVEERAIIKHHIFGDTSDCFNAISDMLFITLINQLVETQTQQLQARPNVDEWFYQGSPCLALTLNTIPLYLHPQWVINALPSYPKVQKTIANLTDALEPQPIQLHVELNPVSLQLNNILRLRVGDVIKTDHPITTPVQLKQNQHFICTAEIGETRSYKSIQLTRSS